MLWISVAVAALTLVSDLAQLNLAKSSSVTAEAAESNDTRQLIIGVLQLITFIVTGVTFLMWIYRANLNARGFGATDMEFTPGWSVGYYFIPFINWFRPYQAMKEIWKVSTNPSDWKNQPSSVLLGWWWTLWLVSSLFGHISGNLSMRVKDQSSLETPATIRSIPQRSSTFRRVSWP